jgi:hypothetical protein
VKPLPSNHTLKTPLVSPASSLCRQSLPFSPTRSCARLLRDASASFEPRCCPSVPPSPRTPCHTSAAFELNEISGTGLNASERDAVTFAIAAPKARFGAPFDQSCKCPFSIRLQSSAKPQSHAALTPTTNCGNRATRNRAIRKAFALRDLAEVRASTARHRLVFFSAGRSHLRVSTSSHRITSTQSRLAISCYHRPICESPG